MDTFNKMLNIPLDYPQEIMDYAERWAGSSRMFVGWLQAVDNDVVQRIFAFRKLKGKQLEITEIVRRITGDQRYIVKNLYLCGYYGYHAVYKKEDRKGICRGYPYIIFSADDFDVWDECSGKAPVIWNKVINPQMLQDTRFRYSGYNSSMGGDAISYLNMYSEHPCVEYFGKMGIRPSKTLIQKAEKDKAFRKWLYRNRDCAKDYGSQAILYAYNHHMNITEANNILKCQREAVKNVPEIKGTEIDRKRLAEYIRINRIGWSTYNDYIKALKKLGLDLADTKNIFPYDFKRMHDMRIAEHDSVMEKENAEKKKKLYADFAAKAHDAKCYEYQSNGFAAVIPERIGDLVREGRALSHCVGQMGYDKKMADGEIIIVFIRSLENLVQPLVTIEYDLKKHRILQAHGDHHRMPTKDEQAFIDEWKKRTNEMMRVKSA